MRMETPTYVPHLSYGERVLFVADGPHPKSGQQCKIAGILPNPSHNPAHQWYDVRFDDGSMHRFLESRLKRLDRQGGSREIPADEWRSFFESFSEQHENWLVHLEAFHGERRLASEHLRLKSISVEAADADGMILIIGEGETTEISHLTRKPTRVLLKQNEAGADEGIQIDSENAAILLRFRAAVLPELVDGIVA
jgi:hypothetical protein